MGATWGRTLRCVTLRNFPRCLHFTVNKRALLPCSCETMLPVTFRRAVAASRSLLTASRANRPSVNPFHARPLMWRRVSHPPCGKPAAPVRSAACCSFHSSPCRGDGAAEGAPTMEPRTEELARELLAGSRLALSRSITLGARAAAVVCGRAGSHVAVHVGLAQSSRRCSPIGGKPNCC